MKPLKRIRYYTMNSWNRSTAPAYDLKVHHVVNNDLRSCVFELMDCEGFYERINWMIHEFDRLHNYEWQAGFNGRSGGYLVLYKGGRKLSDHKSRCTECGQWNFKTVEETGTRCGRCGADARVNDEYYQVFSYPGRSVEDNEVPADVLKSFRKLAVDIVKHVEWMAKNASVEEEEYTVTKTRKVIHER